MTDSWPEWLRQLETNYVSNAARMFVLHFNIDDYVVAPGEHGAYITGLIPFLERHARAGKLGGEPFQAIFRYSHSGDLTPDDKADSVELGLIRMGLGALAGAAVGGTAGGLAGNNAAQAAVAGSVIGAGVAAASQSACIGADLFTQHAGQVGELREPSQVLRVLEAILRSVQQRSLVIIEHADRMAPPPQRFPDREQRLTSEMLTRWATDFVLRNARNLCLLLTRDLQDIDPAIYAPGTGCFPIRVAMPETPERLALLQLMDAQRVQERKHEGIFGRNNPAALAPGLISGLAEIDAQITADTPDPATLEHGDQLLRFADAAKGFRLIEIDQLNRQVRAAHSLQSLHRPAGERAESTTLPRIRLDDVKRHKRRAIEEQSNGLLEIIDTARGFAAIGGMQIVKGYLTALSERIQSKRDRHLIPRGLILAGPPGTGKTIIAEALALESKLNMVKLRNVREGFVGASERNLTRALDVIKVLAPILVFVDEIDQAFGSRGLGQSSDGGTSERIFGQILEFIGDDRNRGEVIWVAATNRPDLLDAALLRRFDRIIPCLLPTPQEQAQILAALPRSIPTLTYTPELRELIARGDPMIVELVSARSDLVPTGAVIETMVRRAAEYAGDRARAQGGSPHVDLEDLRVAVADYRSNADQTMYDYQALLAIQACNFYSVLPELPPRPPFSGLVEPRESALGPAAGDAGAVPQFWREHQVNGVALETQLQFYRRQLGPARHEGGQA